MIDRLLTNPALQYNRKRLKNQERLSPRLENSGGSFRYFTRYFTRAPSTRPGFPTSRELRLSKRGGARWFNASRHQPGSVEAHLGQDTPSIRLK